MVDMIVKVLAAFREPVEYMGVRMFTAFAFAAGVLTLVYLSATDDSIVLSDSIIMTLVAVAGAVLIVAVVARTYTDMFGKDTPQPDEVDGDPVGE